MTEIANSARRSTLDQLVGVSAQVFLGAPALVASLALARWASVRDVAELAAAFGTTATVFGAASFNFSQYLALWGTKGYSERAFWINRIVASLAAVVIALFILLLYGANLELVLLACAIKSMDAMADLRFGLDILARQTSVAMRRLLRWSALRLAIFVSALYSAHLAGASGASSLLFGGGVQFLLLLPWRRAVRAAAHAAEFPAAVRLGRSAAHLALATTACGVLVTLPRLIAREAVPADELGFVGVVFVTSTLVGMFFNVAWYRLASKSRTSDPARALRLFLLEGAAFACVFVFGYWLFTPVVARIYGLADPRFAPIFLRYGAAFVMFYFGCSLANILKSSRFKLLETASYACAAITLTGLTFLGRSLVVGILGASAVLFGFVWWEVRRARPRGAGMRPLALFFRVASRPIPRVARMMSAVRARGLETVFIGAMRDATLGRADEWEGVQVERIGRAFPLVNGARPLTYIGGVVSYGFAAMGVIFARRPALVHASDIETAVPVIIAARLTGVSVIYNIHDNLAVRYAVPNWVAAVLNVIEGLVVCCATVTLVPEPFRRDLLPPWARGRVRVVRNSPDDPGYAAPAGGPASPPRVLFAGWLDYGRGLRQVVELARRGSIHLVVAGEGDERIRQELASTPNVQYEGFCTHKQIMELTAACDYVAAFYDPARTINRYAASNKIAEALAVGRPVLTNTELEVAPVLVGSGAALALPYNQIHELGTLLDAHRANPTQYLEAARCARQLYDSDYHSAQVQRASSDALTAAGCPT